MSLPLQEVTTRIYHPNGADAIPLIRLAGNSKIELEYQKQTDLSYGEAERLLTLNALEGERPLRDHHVDTLTRLMQRGTFRPEFVNIVTCYVKETDKYYRLNGQHTCWARTNMPANWSCRVTLSHYRCKTLADARQLYASIDRGAPRTKGNVINSYLQGTDQFDGCSAKVVQLLASGLAVWLYEFRRTKPDGDELAHLLQTQHADLANHLIDFMGRKIDKSENHMHRAPVFGALYATFSKSRTAAVEFWTPVRSGIGMDSLTDPRLKLRNALMNSVIQSKGGNAGSRSTREAFSAMDMYAWCLNAWNYFRRGDPCRHLKGLIAGQLPKIIK